MEIRAATVIIVEKIKGYLQSIGKNVKSLELDAFLWQEGERNLKNMVNHHRTLTIYY